ncbi:NHL repeat containing protein [Thermodesulfatator indicus DSM 15286]|uniref:NHL repeat containing protein n=1 Tax=Thermodesulfatator indicus (strain DSM 15286 / JCM 11887 / CIR29812) TaxID=667014 RepID=F8ABP1_THEID|nr:SMP-30/gluconolactonase/LRE family protein [Thermodesulfatator indicus]AEH45643.1 NHL repeat containing protein [Thermodesulfatator indicus DSM 15286]
MISNYLRPSKWLIIIVLLGLFFWLSPSYSQQVTDQVSEEALKKALEGTAQRAEPKVIAIIDKDDQGNKLSFPSYLAYDPGRDELYVVDTAKGRIIVYSPDLFPIFSMGKGRGVFAPAGLAIDKQGNIYLCQGTSSYESRPHISVFNAAAIKIKDIFLKGFEGAENFHPRSIAIGQNGKLYVTGIGYRGLIVLDKEGNYIKTLAPKDRFTPETPEKEAIITDVFVDSQGRIYLLSEEMGRFYVYDHNEKFLFKGGQKGGGGGKLSRPRGICADPQKKLIYVVDYMRHTGLVYDYDTGKLKFEFGGRGWNPGWFNYPSDVMIDSFGRIYITDLFNHRVQVLEVEGGPKTSLPLSPVPSFLLPENK